MLSEQGCVMFCALNTANLRLLHQNVETRRRYSEFEAFRNAMAKLYPTLIIPPIPSKQTLGDYAVKQAKAKEDTTLIARRRRMLQVFLNRLARHAILSTEVVLHKFLSGGVSWVGTRFFNKWSGCSRTLHRQK